MRTRAMTVLRGEGYAKLENETKNNSVAEEFS